jgi:hypothetical protein
MQIRPIRTDKDRRARRDREAFRLVQGHAGGRSARDSRDAGRGV